MGGRLSTLQHQAVKLDSGHILDPTTLRIFVDDDHWILFLLETLEGVAIGVGGAMPTPK